MTTRITQTKEDTCLAQSLIKALAGKWKPELFRLATIAPLRFSTLLKQLEGANKQSLTVALRELEELGVLEKQVLKLKPLHIEYTLTHKGRQMVPVFEQLESIGK